MYGLLLVPGCFCPLFSVFSVSAILLCRSCIPALSESKCVYMSGTVSWLCCIVLLTFCQWIYFSFLFFLRRQQPISVTFSNFLIETRVNQKLGLFSFTCLCSDFFFLPCRWIRKYPTPSSRFSSQHPPSGPRDHCRRRWVHQRYIRASLCHGILWWLSRSPSSITVSVSSTFTIDFLVWPLRTFF